MKGFQSFLFLIISCSYIVFSCSPVLQKPTKGSPEIPTVFEAEQPAGPEPQAEQDVEPPASSESAAMDTAAGDESTVTPFDEASSMDEASSVDDASSAVDASTAVDVTPAATTLLPTLEIDLEAEKMLENEQPPDNTPEIQVENVRPPIESEVETRQSDEIASADAADSLNKEPPKKPVQMILDEALGFCEAAQEFWQKGELENALEALDQAYSLILDIEVDDRPSLMQQKEDIRFLISKRILEIYASRNIVVNGNYNAIPLDMNRYVEAEIRRFTIGAEKKFFSQSYIRSGRYRPMITAKLKEAGLPQELSWLPLIESGFKVKALSRARALGLWQFIPSTGYKFGLKRNRYIDERIDPEKSTDAAIAYLKELHQIFGDWTTVLAAYNCGENRVLRVIRSQNVNYLDNFWDLYERLPRETARYVPRFLAALHILNNPAGYGVDSLTPDRPLEFETLEVARQVQLTDIASKINLSGQALKELNPELRYNILPPDKYQLKVPPGKADLLLATVNTIPISHPPRPAYVYHRVRRGETLSGIAERYRTSVRRIMQANNLRRSNYIVAGRKLKIPQRGTVIARASTSNMVATGKIVTHRVRSGDSLWILAKRYATTTKKIQELNGLRTTKLYIGQKLKVPEVRYESRSSDGANQYLVRRGDSPYKIAKQHNMSLGNFLRLNGLTPRSKIYPGQLLSVE